MLREIGPENYVTQGRARTLALSAFRFFVQPPARSEKWIIWNHGGAREPRHLMHDVAGSWESPVVWAYPGHVGLVVVIARLMGNPVLTGRWLLDRPVEPGNDGGERAPEREGLFAPV